MGPKSKPLAPKDPDDRFIYILIFSRLKIRNKTKKNSQPPIYWPNSKRNAMKEIYPAVDSYSYSPGDLDGRV